MNNKTEELGCVGVGASFYFHQLIQPRLDTSLINQ